MTIIPATSRVWLVTVPNNTNDVDCDLVIGWGVDNPTDPVPITARGLTSGDIILWDETSGKILPCDGWDVSERTYRSIEVVVEIAKARGRNELECER